MQNRRSLFQIVRSLFVLPSRGCLFTPIAVGTHGFSYNSNVARVMHIEFDLLQKKWIDRAWNIYVSRNSVQQKACTTLPTMLDEKERLSKMSACALAARKLPHRTPFYFIKTTHTSTSSCAHIALNIHTLSCWCSCLRTVQPNCAHYRIHLLFSCTCSNHSDWNWIGKLFPHAQKCVSNSFLLCAWAKRRSYDWVPSWNWIFVLQLIYYEIVINFTFA